MINMDNKCYIEEERKDERISLIVIKSNPFYMLRRGISANIYI